MKPELENRAPLTYRALAFTAAIPAFLYTASRSLRDGGRRYLRQRYASGLPTDLKDRICLHCCSVGEVRAALPLARELLGNGHNLFISVGTPTGRHMARTLLPEIPCIYFPLDHVSVVSRWLKRLNPKTILIVETELWPNFFHAARRLDIPMALVNARLSQRTQNPPFLLRPALRQAAQQLHCILTRSEKDAERFAALGAPPDRIENLGNIKYAAAIDDIPDDAPIQRPYVLAVSTHKDEEKLIAKLWKTLDPRGKLLVLMPRYPDRAPEILKHLEALGLRAGLHSRDHQPRPDDQTYLADTLGEALWWMRHAAFVFVGGSLIPRGGHNVMEPAMLGKACVVGPHTDNFEAEVRALLDCDGLRQVKDAKELSQTFSQWLEHPDEAKRIGMRAQIHVRDRNQLVKRYVETLRRYSVIN
ncbi:MAG: hypothetical protein OXN23_04395 [Gammaproteobacteria bacterium]|nr:hypothetical protein [Gammaproteobacteria bacterium]MDE0301624.1 hypothetical protein [Gammaproteobacteria bacterium]MDE0612460.1 hypothetical protein [Gammaproteobacteria bacterium]